MPKASVKRSIECKKGQLIDLVLDIEKYPQFVPFCLNSKIYEKQYKIEPKFPFFAYLFDKKERIFK